ncbi:MAG: 2Fe-2S iron-sulfur cluster binding domain-containing protein [Gammaproteobacteria bacterium]|nr:2Fe-2S iron-sulfur cluster binding domain-containing protein [Gammaproteobacteria bacterium]
MKYVASKRHKITITDSLEEYACAENQHLLNGMMSLGKRGIPSGCHGGGCGVCKVKITKGSYKTSVMSRKHITKEDEMLGIVLACRAFPTSNITLKVIGKLSKNILKEKNKKYGLV